MRQMVRWAKIVALTMVASVSVVALGARPSAAASPSDPHTVADLLAAFHIGAIPADFVVVVDVSGSMSTEPPGNPPYPAVKAAYAQLVAAIAPGDHLSVVTFSTDAQLAFDGVIQTAQDRTQALAALPPRATGPLTDIGAALSETLARLTRPDASQVETVLFMTDGILDASANSPYASPSSPAWKALGQQGQAVARDHLLQSFGVGLGQGRATDIGLLRGVLPDPTIVALPPDQLGPFFQEAVEKTQLLKLQQPLQQELTQGGVQSTVTSQPKLAKHVTVTVKLSSHYKVLPCDVTLTGVHITDGSKAVPASLVGGPRTVHLEPGQSRTVQVEATLPVPGVGIQVPQKHEAQQVDVRVDGTATAQPSALITQLYQFGTAKTLAPAGAVTLQRTVGWPIWAAVLVAIVALIILGALGAFVRWLVVPPPLVGVFIPTGEGMEGRRPVPLKGKRMTIDSRKLPEAGPAAIDVFTKARHRNRVFAIMRKPDFEVQGRHRHWERITGEHSLSSGGTYRIGAARVRWWRKRDQG